MRETQNDQLRLLTRIEEEWNAKLADCAATATLAATAANEHLRRIEEELERLLESRASKVVSSLNNDDRKRELAVREAEVRLRGLSRRERERERERERDCVTLDPSQFYRLNLILKTESAMMSASELVAARTIADNTDDPASIPGES